MKHQIYEVCRIFFFVFMVVGAQGFAKESGEKNGRARALGICAAWCLAIALMAWTDAPSCQSLNPGVCERLVDKQLAEALVFWLLLLGTPVLFGVFESRRYARNPWGKPEEDDNVVVKAS